MREILNAARANDFSSKSLGGMAGQSAEELLGFLPPATTDRLDAQLEKAIEGAYRQLREMAIKPR